MLISSADCRQLASATYWLGTLFRRGESLPDGIGYDAAAQAAELVRRLQLTSRGEVFCWPVAGRFKALIRLESAAFASELAAEMRGAGLAVEFREPDLIEVST